MTDNTDRIPQWEDAPDIDDGAYSICTENGEDCIYLRVGLFAGRVWCWVSIDMDSNSYCGGASIEGPFRTWLEATEAGLAVAHEVATEWMLTSGGDPLTPEDYREQRDAILDDAHTYN